VARSNKASLRLCAETLNQAFLDELCAFPEGAHDDQVDACSGGMTLLSLPTGAIDDAPVNLCWCESRAKQFGQSLHERLVVTRLAPTRKIEAQHHQSHRSADSKASCHRYTHHLIVMRAFRERAQFVEERLIPVSAHNRKLALF